MWDEIVAAFWFFGPAGVANIAPVLAANLKIFKSFNTPLDGGKKWHGKRIFGDHKTFRGLIAGYLGALIIVALQKYLAANGSWPESLTWFDYGAYNTFALAGAFGVGAIIGDAIKSFFKRRAGVAPGESWFPLDQIDYIVGGLLITAPWLGITIRQVALVLIIYFLLHLINSYLGYLLGLKDKPI